MNRIKKLSMVMVITIQLGADMTLIAMSVSTEGKIDELTASLLAAHEGISVENKKVVEPSTSLFGGIYRWWYGADRVLLGELVNKKIDANKLKEFEPTIYQAFDSALAYQRIPELHKLLLQLKKYDVIINAKYTNDIAAFCQKNISFLLLNFTTATPDDVVSNLLDIIEIIHSPMCIREESTKGLIDINKIFNLIIAIQQIRLQNAFSLHTTIKSSETDMFNVMETESESTLKNLKNIEKLACKALHVTCRITKDRSATPAEIKKLYDECLGTAQKRKLLQNITKSLKQLNKNRQNPINKD